MSYYEVIPLKYGQKEKKWYIYYENSIIRLNC